ncbi:MULTISPECIES: hypothetical protein [Cyanophyceae]|uniref:hypothetical protein n=1 Tax=Cyanophyceae TaxID=3028117 RepID=UPI001683FA51|nr:MULTISPECIES: hypothetical protein [Cyanophyceae]MBD1919509.1 hypothetical protein [Phormidium sp. FACHB-77]MBD2054426.1 hypothetical protein [Leptolyngbya sp. FACHB-60]
MTTEESLGDRISKHFFANLPQESRVENVETEDMTVYDVVKSCFKQITLFRKTEKDWAVAAPHLMSSFEAVTSQKISISSYTLRSYYYAIKAKSGGKKNKNSKSKKRRKPSVAKSSPVVKSVVVVEAEAIELEAAADIPKDTVSVTRKSRKKAAAEEGGFQVPRRPGFIPPVHL